MKHSIPDPKRVQEQMEALCAAAEHSSHELRLKMLRKGLSPAQADDIIAHLRNHGFVNDARFARAYVADHYRFRRWGRLKLTAGLYSHHIHAADIRAALADIDHELYRQNLTSLLHTKRRQLGDDASTYEGRTKLFRYGASRGYEAQLVAEVLRDRSFWHTL